MIEEEDDSVLFAGAEAAASSDDDDDSDSEDEDDSGEEEEDDETVVEEGETRMDPLLRRPRLSLQHLVFIVSLSEAAISKVAEGASAASSAAAAAAEFSPLPLGLNSSGLPITSVIDADLFGNGTSHPLWIQSGAKPIVRHSEETSERGSGGEGSTGNQSNAPVCPNANAGTSGAPASRAWRTKPRRLRRKIVSRSLRRWRTSRMPPGQSTTDAPPPAGRGSRGRGPVASPPRPRRPLLPALSPAGDGPRREQARHRPPGRRREPQPRPGVPDQRRREARVRREQARASEGGGKAPGERGEARKGEDRGHGQRRVRLEADDEGALGLARHRLSCSLVQDDVEAGEEGDGAVEDVAGEAPGPERGVLRVARYELGHEYLEIF